jgi:hypothetical protein
MPTSLWVCTSTTPPSCSPAFTRRTARRSGPPWRPGSGPLKGSRVIDTPQDVRFVNDETAIVVSEGGILFPGETICPADRMVRATWVIAKRDGRWFVAAYHNSPLN